MTNKVAQFCKAAAKKTVSTEEAVITLYQQLLDAKEWPRPFGCDGLFHDTLFEFKLDMDVESNYALPLAQCCYYLRRLLYVGVYRVLRGLRTVALSL